MPNVAYDKGILIGTVFPERPGTIRENGYDYGKFLCVDWEERPVVFNDALGLFNVVCYQDKQRLILSDRLLTIKNRLEELGISVTSDKIFYASKKQMDHPLGMSTPYEEIKRVAPAKKYVLQGNTLSEYSWYSFDCTQISTDDLENTFCDVFSRVCKHYSQKETLLMLTGGLDSRLVYSWCDENTDAVHYQYAGETERSIIEQYPRNITVSYIDEKEISLRLTEQAIRRNGNVDVNERLRDRKDSAPKYRLTGGNAAFLNGVFMEERLSHLDHFSLSVGFSNISDYHPKNLVTHAYNLQTESLKNAFTNLWNQLNRQTQNEWQTLALYHLYHSTLRNPVTWDEPRTVNISPFLSLPLFEACLGTPKRNLLFHNFFKTIYEKHCPKLAEIRNYNWSTSLKNSEHFAITTTETNIYDAHHFFIHIKKTITQ
jgi:hypothetical protein